MGECGACVYPAVFCMVEGCGVLCLNNVSSVSPFFVTSADVGQ